MSETSFVPRGAASHAVEYDGPPRDFYFLLLPKLTLLAFSAALEPLRIANQVAGKTLYRWYVLTEDAKPVRCSCGVQLTPDKALQDVPREALAFICAGVEPGAHVSPRVVHWIGRQKAHGARIGGICTGAFALAQAGLLSGRRFTLHWENQPAFVERYLDLQPTDRLFEDDAGLLTCGGGSAATDMMLALIEQDFGSDLAAVVADMCLHQRPATPDAPQRSLLSQGLGSRNPHLMSAVEVMTANLEAPLDIESLVGEVGLSRRQMERLFRQHTGLTPGEYYMGLRVSRAHALLNETTLSVAEIAAATGFASSSQLSQRFRARYGQSPGAYRRSWLSRGG